jgi:hypothetical protein
MKEEKLELFKIINDLKNQIDKLAQVHKEKGNLMLNNGKSKQNQNDGWHVIPPRRKNAVKAIKRVDSVAVEQNARVEPKNPGLVDGNKNKNSHPTKTKNSYADAAKIHPKTDRKHGEPNNRKPKYTPIMERNKTAIKNTINQICKTRSTPAIEVGTIYIVIQDSKPFIAASKNRDFQSQRYLMNGICRRFGISKWVLNKVLIGNGLIQLFINKSFEGEIADMIEEKGGQFKFDTDIKAGEIPQFLTKKSVRERAAKNTVNRAERLYTSAPTKAMKNAVLKAYEGSLLSAIKKQIIKFHSSRNPAEEGYQWIFDGNNLVETLVETEIDEDESPDNRLLINSGQMVTEEQNEFYLTENEDETHITKKQKQSKETNCAQEAPSQ